VAYWGKDLPDDVRKWWLAHDCKTNPLPLPPTPPTPLPPPPPPGARLALATTISGVKEGKGVARIHSAALFDSAHVLLESVKAATADSKYPTDFVMFVHPETAPEDRIIFTGMGWIVIEKDVPVTPEEVRA
jgi:hypothetical protein